MGWRAQHNREEDKRERYFAETTWWQRAADRLRTALILVAPITVVASVYWIIRGR